jgi:CubicO group peptidase (beta-lactamase class C family)
MSASSLPTATTILERGINEGLHIGAQLYVSRKGEPVADLALGESRPGVPMTPDTLMLWLSASKPVTAVAVAQMWERGKLRLDDRVAQHIPEFGENGKKPVTLRHVLTHTAGFRWVDTGWPNATWDETIARICAAKQERGWVAGRSAGYSPYASWFVLGEIVRRLDDRGRDFGRYVREEIFEPLGMRDSWLALPPDRYRAYGDRIGVMHKTEGAKVHDAGLDTERHAAAPRPSGGGRGPARELGRFYEMLLAGGTLNGVRLLSPQAVDAMTARHRAAVRDETFKHVMDWGLGFIINSNQYGPDTVPYGYGPHASPRTFGHSGSQSSSAFADPDKGLVVACVCNGMPGEPAHQSRMRAIHAAIYEDLRLQDPNPPTARDGAIPLP